ncbi:putative deoxyribonuclease TATDN2 [Mya arenaria]|uniref:putative deoxyribonuclease TATDN2 n=1 Tax=Mya arenaria TaxID=6604 RepID=UPI0022E71588|nr:putative deoxyribonuclease TATDN2 [Mya arenaria]
MELEKPLGWDSHFHLASMASRARLPVMDITTVLECQPSDSDFAIKLEGGVAVFCDPKSAREQEDNLWQLLYMLKGRVKPSQRIHLHCLTGDRETVDLLVTEFPNVCFGYTSLIASCSETTKEALRALDPSRLLLETDSPFFKAKGAKLGSPLHLRTMANAVARYRSESWQEILQLACSNGKRLYAPSQ